MQPSADHSDDFFREQLRQLRAKGHSPEEATDILLRAQKAVLAACQKLLERYPPGDDADVNGRAQS